MDFFDSLPPFHYLVAYYIPCILLGAFIGCMVAPYTICEAVHMPQPRDKPLNIFFYLFAIRELVLGLALLLLEVYNEWRGVTILLACIGINGASDFVIAGFYSGKWWSSFTAHGFPTLLGYWTVWKLWQELF